MGGEDRADKWTGTGNGGEVMSEDDPLVGDEEVAAVFQAFRGRGAEGIDSKYLGGDELAVEAISEGVAAGCRCHQPQGINRLLAMNGDDSDRGD